MPKEIVRVLKDKVTINEAIDIFRNSGTNVAATCRIIGVPRTAWIRLIQTDADFARRVEEAKEEVVDNVESNLMRLIGDGDVTATIFFLKTRGKMRGYSERYSEEIDNANRLQVAGAEVNYDNLSVEEIKTLETLIAKASVVDGTIEGEILDPTKLT